MIGNCMRPNDTFDRFNAFELSPCINDPVDGVQRCEANMQDFWTIYGCIPNSAEVYALHDALNEDDAAAWLCAVSKETGKGVQFSCGRTGRLLGKMKPFTPSDLAMAMTEEIHDSIPEGDDPDTYRDDDFENHPLAPIREALCAASGAMGLARFDGPFFATVYTVTTDDQDGVQSWVFTSMVEAEDAAETWCRKRWSLDWGEFPDHWTDAYANNIEDGDDTIMYEPHIIQLGGVAAEIVKSAKAQMNDLIEQIDQMRGLFPDDDGRIQQAIDDAEAWPNLSLNAK